MERYACLIRKIQALDTAIEYVYQCATVDCKYSGNDIADVHYLEAIRSLAEYRGALIDRVHAVSKLEESEAALELIHSLIAQTEQMQRWLQVP